MRKALPEALTDPSDIYLSLRRLDIFPQRMRLDVAQAIARLVDVETHRWEQRNTTGSCIDSLALIHSLGGDEALSAWCDTIRESGCLIGSQGMERILSGVARWLRTEVDASHRKANGYAKQALIRAANTLNDPRVLFAFDRDSCYSGLEEGVRSGIAASLAIAGARWGVEKAARMASSLDSLELASPGFLLSGSEIARSSGSDIGLLTSALEEDSGRMLFAVPSIEKGTLARLMRRPGEIIGSVLRREGMEGDLSLTLAERKARLGRMSAMMDLRALKHPDKGVRMAAIDRLVDIISNPDFGRLRYKVARDLAFRGLFPHEFSEESISKLRGVITDPQGYTSIVQGMQLYWISCREQIQFELEEAVSLLFLSISHGDSHEYLGKFWWYTYEPITRWAGSLHHFFNKYLRHSALSVSTHIQKGDSETAQAIARPLVDAVLEAIERLLKLAKKNPKSPHKLLYIGKKAWNRIKGELRNLNLNQAAIDMRSEPVLETIALFKDDPEARKSVAGALTRVALMDPELLSEATRTLSLYGEDSAAAGVICEIFIRKMEAMDLAETRAFFQIMREEKILSTIRCFRSEPGYMKEIAAALAECAPRLFTKYRYHPDGIADDSAWRTTSIFLFQDWVMSVLGDEMSENGNKIKR